MAAKLEAALARDRAICLAALIALTLIAWAWLLMGAGMGMKPLASLAPAAMGDAPGAMAGMPGSATPARFGVTLAMWWTMMVAMMLPSAAPMVLLYARAAGTAPAGPRPSTAMFLTGYLIAWGAFSLLAGSLQLLLERAELLAPMTLALHGHGPAGVLLVLAGIYQLSPLKTVCLRHCRNPAQFLASHYRPGRLGALRMGLSHGSYCIGCCWLLMLLLFAAGVMNLVWIALLTLMVAAEKLLPGGRYVSVALGLASIALGGIIFMG